MRDAQAKRREPRMTRSRHAGVLAVALAVSAAAPATRATEILAVIGHPGTAAARNQREIADIFRGVLRLDTAGHRVVPLNLPGDHPLRRAFSLALFHQLPQQMETYWNERYFHGVSPPYVVASVEAMLRFVAATPGAIGYVPGCAVDARVTVIAEIEADELVDACPPEGATR